MNLVLKNTNNKRNPHLKSQFPSDHISPHFFLRLKILTLFKFYLKFLVFEFHFFHACVNLDFYLIIYGLELPVRLKSDKASGITEILGSF